MADFSGEGFRICTLVPTPTPPTPPAILGYSTGPIEGGTRLTFVGGTMPGGAPIVFVDTSRDDDFAGVVIDPTKWVASTTGSGSVAQDDALLLRTGAVANSSAVLTSVPAFGTVVDLRATWSIGQAVMSSPPADTTRFLDVELRVDASNYFRVSRVFDVDAPDRHLFRIVCVMGGTTVEDIVLSNDAVRGTIRVYRIRNRVLVYLNSFLVYDYAPFSTDADAYVVFRAVNPSATESYAFTTTVDSFEVATVALFDDDPAVVRLLSTPTAVRIESPLVALPKTASISVYTAAGLVVYLQSVFVYSLTFEFRVLTAGGAAIGIVNDRTLRNTTSDRPGFLV